MKNTFAFLLATRFWMMAVAALSVYAEQKGWIGVAERNLIASMAAGFVVVRTVDRATEQGIIGAAVSSGQLSDAAVAATPGLTTDPVKTTLKPEPIKDHPPIDAEVLRAIRDAVSKALGTMKAPDA
jgi:hypothetical protein